MATLIRRVMSCMLLAGVLGATVWVALRTASVGPLAQGQSMPALPIVSMGTRTTLLPSGDESTVLVLFHTGCEFCKRQFEGLEGAPELLARTRFVLLTVEDSIDRADLEGLWPTLFGSKSTVVGTVEAEAFWAAFGILTTPANFVFDSTGRLLAWAPGMVQPEWITAALDGGGGARSEGELGSSCGPVGNTGTACGALPQAWTTIQGSER